MCCNFKCCYFWLQPIIELHCLSTICLFFGSQFGPHLLHQPSQLSVLWVRCVPRGPVPTVFLQFLARKGHVPLGLHQICSGRNHQGADVAGSPLRSIEAWRLQLVQHGPTWRHQHPSSEVRARSVRGKCQVKAMSQFTTWLERGLWMSSESWHCGPQVMACLADGQSAPRRAR